MWRKCGLEPKINAIHRKFTQQTANQMSEIISDFRMNVMRGQIVQVAKWGAWAVLEQRCIRRSIWTELPELKATKYQSPCTWPGSCYWLKWPGNSKSSLLLKYGPVVNACYCFIVVDVVPSGKAISHKMTVYLEEAATKKRSGEDLLHEAKKMRLASLTPSVVGICLRLYWYLLPQSIRWWGVNVPIVCDDREDEFIIS